MRRELALWEAWEAEGAVTADEARRLRRITLYALTVRWYGPAALDQDSFAPPPRAARREAGSPGPPADAPAPPPAG